MKIKILLILIFFYCGKIFSQQKLLIPFMQNKKWGFIDASKNWVIKPLYSNVKEFYKGTAVVVNDSQMCALIDTNGKFISDFIYSDISEFTNDITTAAKPDPARPTEWASYDGLDSFEVKHEKKGWINYLGKEITGFNFDWMGDWTGELAQINVRGFYGFMNAKGKVVIVPKFRCFNNEFFSWFSDGLTLLCNEYKLAVFDTNGKQLSKFLFSPSWNYYGETGFCNGVCPVRFGNKEVFIDKTGKILKYDSATYANNVARRDSINAADDNGEDIERNFPIPNGNKRGVRNGYAIYTSYVYPDGSMAFLNTNEFMHVGRYFDGVMKVKKDDKYGFVDVKGNIVVPIKYQDIENFENGLAKVWKKTDKKYGRKQIGYVDKTGQEYLWENPE